MTYGVARDFSRLHLRQGIQRDRRGAGAERPAVPRVPRHGGRDRPHPNRSHRGLVSLRQPWLPGGDRLDRRCAPPARAARARSTRARRHGAPGRHQGPGRVRAHGRRGHRQPVQHAEPRGGDPRRGSRVDRGSFHKRRARFGSAPRAAGTGARHAVIPTSLQGRAELLGAVACAAATPRRRRRSAPPQDDLWRACARPSSRRRSAAGLRLRVAPPSWPRPRFRPAGSLSSVSETTLLSRAWRPLRRLTPAVGPLRDHLRCACEPLPVSDSIGSVWPITARVRSTRRRQSMPRRDRDTRAPRGPRPTPA